MRGADMYSKFEPIKRFCQRSHTKFRFANHDDLEYGVLSQHITVLITNITFGLIT